jgi:hypothetical protein
MTSKPIRGYPGCVVQSEPVAQLEWEEAGQGFRAEGSGLTVDEMTDALAQFILIASASN